MSKQTFAPASQLLLILAATVMAAADSSNAQQRIVDDYDQWREALNSRAAVAAARITAAPGFEVSLIRSAKPDEGSWVSMAFDPTGRIILAREDKGLLRLTQASNDKTKLETVQDSLLECRGLLFAFDALYANANNSKGLYRLRDTTGDGVYDEAKLLRKTPGGVGHGRNDLALGPDGHIYLIHGNDVRLPNDYVSSGSPHRNFQEDRLLQAGWDRQLFNAGVKPPAGHVIRTDRDGRKWELVAGGFRNPFGIAFNGDGEMFTYDADMEWDVGAPWYRPTRINHIVSGGDYGWRQGVKKWPGFYADSLPTTLDIGLGSPTAVAFGQQAKFPEKYRRALYVCDWAYGRILAIHLDPNGASYRAKEELFVKGRPLNVTDVAFGPDGAMYFITGGRKTQSGLYRVRYTGPLDEVVEPTPAAAARLAASAKARSQRRRLESLHRPLKDAVPRIWPSLGSDDRWLRYAARIALEHQPIDQWRDRALREDDPAAGAEALLALVRVGDDSDRRRGLSKLAQLPWKASDKAAPLTIARATAVGVGRLGEMTADQKSELRRAWESRFPSGDPEIDQIVCELLVEFDSPLAVPSVLKQLAKAKTQEEKLSYLFALRLAKSGWTKARRRSYFSMLQDARQFYGARFMPQFIDGIRADAVAGLDEKEKLELAAVLQPPPSEPPKSQLAELKKREFVKRWEMDDLAGSVAELHRPGGMADRDLKQGAQVFEQALCGKCHRVVRGGGDLGPELTDVTKRFSGHDILRSILAPSEVVAEKYQNTTVVDSQGRVTTGRVFAELGGKLVIGVNPFDLNAKTDVALDQVDERFPSLVSPMPSGLLDTFSKAEILDLLAYIDNAANEAKEKR